MDAVKIPSRLLCLIGMFSLGEGFITVWFPAKEFWALSSFLEVGVVQPILVE